MNLQKDESSYSHGMKPVIYSVEKNKKNGTHAWQRGGEKVTYWKNLLKMKLQDTAVKFIMMVHISLFSQTMNMTRKTFHSMCTKVKLHRPLT